MSKMKVVHLTSVHPPLDIRVFRKECKTLVNSGYEAVIVAPYDQDDLVDGVQIRAVPKPRGRMDRISRTVWQVYRTALKEDAQLYHFHDPELIPVGLLFKLRGKRVVYDAHENVPQDILSKDYIPVYLRGIIAMLAGLIEIICTTLFDKVIAATPAIARRFSPGRTIIVQNFPVPGELVPSQSSPYATRPSFISYVGVIEDIRGIREMVKAMALLPATLEARLVLGGYFSPSGLEDELRLDSLAEWVEFRGWLSREEIAVLFDQSRIGIVTLHPTPAYLESWPIKLFEYMSAGIPVIASDFPLWRQVIEGSGCGVVVNPLDPRAVGEAIAYLLLHSEEAEEMGRRGREAINSLYNWNNEAKKLLDFYKEQRDNEEHACVE